VRRTARQLPGAREMMARRATVRPLARWGVAVLAAAATLTACSGGSDADLVVYSGRSEALVGPLVERFEKDSGLDVEVRYAGTAELAAQLLEEGGRSPADAFLSQDAGALGALAKADRLRPLPTDLTSRVPERFRADDGAWVGVTGRARVIVHNTRRVPAAQVPDSVFALTEPRWRDRVGYAPTNASFQSFVTAMRVLAGEERTERWLRDLLANEPVAYANNVQVLEAVERGEVDLGLINHYYWFEKRAEVGEEELATRVAFLAADDPGALVNISGVGVLSGSTRREAAERFAAFLLADEAQRYFATTLFEYPLLPGVPPPPGLPPLSQVSGPPIDLADLDTLEQTLQLLDEVGAT
jgi:iron(III) transport system substrate-binding protein